MVQGHKQSELIMLVERRSGHLLGARLPKLTAELTQQAMVRCLAPPRGACPDRYPRYQLGMRRPRNCREGLVSKDIFL